MVHSLQGSLFGQNGSGDRGYGLYSIGIHLLRRFLFDHQKTRVCHERLKNERRAYMFSTKPSKMFPTRVTVHHHEKGFSKAFERQDVS